MIWVTTIADMIDRAAVDSAPNAGVVFPEDRVTWSELGERADEYARALVGLGVRRGDKVAILMPNQLEFVIAFVAIAKLGAISVPVNGRFKVHELAYVLEHADARLLFTASAGAAGGDYPSLIAEVFPTLADADPFSLELSEAPELRQIVDLSDTGNPGFLTARQFLAAGADVSVDEIRTMQGRVRVRDVGMLMYTSGTTARPKGCLLSHEGLVRNAITIAETNYHLTHEDAFWDPLPLFHIGGIVPVLSCASAGCKYVHAGHFDPDVAIRQLVDEHATVCYPTFETIWLAILDHPEFDAEKLSGIRLIHNVGVPERLLQMQQRLPNAIQCACFGCTEGSSHLTFPSLDDPVDVRMTTLGPPLRGLELKIVDPETGNEVPTGEKGELVFRGYSLFEGYYKDPENTKNAIDADGFFHTGDLCSVDEYGRLRYAGRLKDMLKVGGENVSALEVEDYIARHPSVSIVQVVSAPDAKYEEVAAAYVQLRQGAEATEEELISFCVGKIASFKVPRYVRFVEEWPMSGTKIQKFVLRERIATELRERGMDAAPRVGSRATEVRS